MRTLIFPSFKNSNPKSKKKTTKKAQGRLESTLEIVGYQCGSDRTMAKIQMKPKLKKEEEQAQVSTVLSSFVSRLIVVAGTYDGVLVGWDSSSNNESSPEVLKMSFALAGAHEGSVRSLEMNCGQNEPGQLISAGYDEVIKVLDLNKHVERGEARTPPELKTPMCMALAPPSGATHALVGLSSGTLVLYDIKTWNVVHVLGGHTSPNKAGVSCVAVHPSGKLALSGGRADGTIRVWDLMRGRLAHVHTVTKGRSIDHLIWSKDGSRFAFCHKTHLTVRDVATGHWNPQLMAWPLLVNSMHPRVFFWLLFARMAVSVCFV